MIDEQRYRSLIQQLATGGIAGNKTYHQVRDQYMPIDSESMGYMNGGGVGSMMQPRMNFKLGGGEFEEDQTIGLTNIINSDLPQSNNTDVAFTPGSFLDNQINKLNTLEQMGFPQPKLEELKQKDMKQFQKTGTPLSLPKDQYAMAISNYDDLFSPKTMNDVYTGSMNLDGTVAGARDFSNFDKARMGNANEITDRNRGQVIERNPSAPFNRGFTMADIAGPSTIDRFSNSVGPTPNEITDRNRGQIGSNNLAQDLAGVARNTTQAEFDSLVDDDFEEMKGINFRDSPVGLFNRQNNIATGIIDKNITNKAYNTGTPQATAEFLAANDFPIPENLKQFLEIEAATGKYISKKSPNNFMSFINNVPTPFGLARRGLGAVFGANSPLSRKMRGVNEKTGLANTQAQYEQNRTDRQAQSRTDNMVDRISKGKSVRSNPRDAGTTTAQKNDISAALQDRGRTGQYSKDGSGSGSGCFIKGTLITMADGSTKEVQKVDLGDNVAKGGKVFATGKFLVENLHDYKGIQVSGSHMVNEDNTWVRVEDSKHGKSLGDDEHVVYVFGSENRRILINDILFTDYFEVKDQEQLLKEKDKFFDNWKTFAINEDSSNVNTLNAN